VEQIAVSAQRMSGLSDELVSAMDSVSAVVEENTAATEEMAASSREVTGEIESIASVSQENSGAIEQVSAWCSEMSAQVQGVNAAAQSLAALAESLQEVVSRFNLEGEKRNREVGDEGSDDKELHSRAKERGSLFLVASR
jgi:methyl-accepting chemotaxis protein